VTIKRASFFSGIIPVGIVLGWTVILWLFITAGNQHQEVASERMIRILVWGDIFDKAMIREFEEKTGIKVQLSAYTTNEELLVKLKMTQGYGYDLISPSDYAVSILRAEELLKPLDTTKMPFITRINPFLLHKAYDPENTVSIPYEWEVFGIAFDKDFFKHHPLQPSWKMLFKDPRGEYRVVMTDDLREMVRSAAHYLFGPVDDLSEEQTQKVEELLKQQHQWVEAYTSTNLDYYLISEYSPLAYSSSAYVGRRKQFASKLGFFVPQEGGLITIENLAIPIHGEHDDLVYQFMNFMFDASVMAHHFDLFTYFPATPDFLTDDMKETLDPEMLKLLTMSAQDFQNLIFIKPVMPEDRMNDLWVSIKS
jgi:spermidine/putrescine transport system substrate-binding protein